MPLLADQGRSTIVQVVNQCPTCGAGDIELSPAAFQQLAPLDAGRIPVGWDFV